MVSNQFHEDVEFHLAKLRECCLEFSSCAKRVLSHVVENCRFSLNILTSKLLLFRFLNLLLSHAQIVVRGLRDSGTAGCSQISCGCVSNLDIYFAGA